MTDDFNFFDNLEPKTKTEEKAEPKKEEPKQEAIIDLADVLPEKREAVAHGAKLANIKVINKHLLDEARKPKAPRQAMLLEFPENPPSEAQGMTPLFRLSRRQDLDILFCGLNIGPMFQDRIEAAVKKKYEVEDKQDGVLNEHYVVFIYLALALPFGENEQMNSGWSLTFFPPKNFERIIPKALRTRLGIDIWYKQAGNRFDVIYYKVQKVKNQEEKEEAIYEARRTSNIAYALTTLNAPYPEVPKQTIERWIAEYYEKHPEEKPENKPSPSNEEEVAVEPSEVAETQEPIKEVAPIQKTESRSSLF